MRTMEQILERDPVKLLDRTIDHMVNEELDGWHGVMLLMFSIMHENDKDVRCFTIYRIYANLVFDGLIDPSRALELSQKAVRELEKNV